jgi:NADH-quinone oxidoreductase subunit L
VAIFHLMTHAFFKALLFLGAGSVIIGMHHDQDIRNMGGLRKYMPITWITSLIGSLALIGTPLFAGFYSKDSIIEAVKFSNIPGSGFAYFAVMAGVFVTAFYSFRMYFLVFHGEERFGKAHDDHGHVAHAKAAHDDHAGHDSHGSHDGDHDDEEVSHDHHHGLAPGQKPHESPWVVTLPLVLLAIPSVIIGFIGVGPLVFGDYFKMTIPGTNGIPVIFIDNAAHPAMAEFATHFHGAVAMAMHAFSTAPFWLALSGVVLSWFFYMKRPDIPAAIKARFEWLYTILENKYYFDKFNEAVFAGGARLLGKGLWKGGDVAVIDGLINGSAKSVGWIATIVRFFQTGHIYSYAFTMIIGVVVLMTLWVVRA